MASIIALNMPEGPNSNHHVPVILLIVIIVAALCLAIIIAIAIRCRSTSRRNRKLRQHSEKPKVSDIEAQKESSDSGKDDGRQRTLILPALSRMVRSWSSTLTAAQVMSGNGPGARSGAGSGSEKTSGGLPLPAAHVKVSASSRLRDSVLCKAISQLPRPDASKVKRSQHALAEKTTEKISKPAEDVEAQAGLQSTSIPAPVDSDSSLSYPEWVRPYLPTFREQSKKEWSVYLPETGLVAASTVTPVAPTIPVPIIVVQPCIETVPTPDSPVSIYSQDSSFESSSSGHSTSPPETPSKDSTVLMSPTLASSVSLATLASPVSFYFPSEPSFSEQEYLQAPIPSWLAPRSEDSPIMRKVSGFSGKLFVLRSPPSPSPLILNNARQMILERRRTVQPIGDWEKENSSVDFGTCFQPGPTRRREIKRPTHTGFPATFSTASCMSDVALPECEDEEGGTPLTTLSPTLAARRRRAQRRRSKMTAATGYYSGSGGSDTIAPYAGYAPEVASAYDSPWSSVSVSLSASPRTTVREPGQGCGPHLDPTLKAILDQYRWREMDDDDSVSLHSALDEWVNAVTRRNSTGAARSSLSPALPGGDSAMRLTYDCDSDCDPSYGML